MVIGIAVFVDLDDDERGGTLMDHHLLSIITFHGPAFAAGLFGCVPAGRKTRRGGAANAKWALDLITTTVHVFPGSRCSFCLRLDPSPTPGFQFVRRGKQWLMGLQF